MANRITHIVSEDFPVLPVAVQADDPANTGFIIEIKLVGGSNVIWLPQRNVELVIWFNFHHVRCVTIALFVDWVLMNLQVHLELLQRLGFLEKIPPPGTSSPGFVQR
jgi:hypothetical protein